MVRLLCLVLCPLAAAQTPDIADTPPLLARIASIVRENIERLPNYTCTMTVNRAERILKTGKSQMADRLRLEVAMVGHQELYAWPGSRKFRDQPIQNIAPAGAFSTGEFGIFPDAIFLSGSARFDYDGLEELNGRKVYRFVYMIPRERSKYVVIVPRGKGVVGYEGSAWCDAASLDLVRLEIVMREIPEDLRVSGGRLVIDYARVPVGRGDFLLPRSVDSTFTFDGLESHNHTVFSGCREYAAESAISFGELPASEEPARPSSPSPVLMPAGVIIESRLETSLDPARLATGDAFEATVTKAARQKSLVVAPKGARIHGHVAGIVAGGKSNGCVGVELHPDWIEFEGREGIFDAEQLAPLLPMNGPRSRLICPWQPEPGSAMVLMEAGRLASASGYPIVWRTLKPAEEK
jgi:hypothetical protein